MKFFAVAFALAGLAPVSVSAQAEPPATDIVTETDGGHLLGNPNAEVKLTEYVSYTCPHCGSFAVEGDPPLKLFYVRSGKVSLEVRNFVTNVVDLTAALATNCGATEKFPDNHNMMMLAQSEWLAKARNATEGQQQRWMNGDFASRRRAIANDLGFYDLMETRGYQRTELDKCLSDDGAAAALIKATNDDVKNLDVPGTPSFAINGELLEDTHSWQALRPVLDDAVKPYLKPAVPTGPGLGS